VHVSVANGIVYVGGSDVRGLSLETGKMVRSFSGLRSAETVPVGSGLLFAATETELSVLHGGEEVRYTAANETYGAGVEAILGALGITVVLHRRAA
jgi:hypothetical protein